MKNKRNILIAANILLVAILACNLPAGATQAEGTQTAAAQTLAAEQTGTGLIPVTGPTSTPTITLTPTPSVPTATVSQNTNCRSGPGVGYDLLGALLVGEFAEVVGKSTPTSYWIIKNPDASGNCWLWGQYALVSGNTAGLPEYPVPPTPTPSLPAAPKNFQAQISCTLTTSNNNGIFLIYQAVHVELTWEDVATNEEGYRVFRDGNLLATLGANTSNYSDDTTLPGLILQGNPPPSVTYGVESFNGAGKSDRKEKELTCP